MLCTYCSNIDLGQCRTEEGYKHHLNYFHMRKAADQGCKLCELIGSKFDKWITKMQWCDNYLGGAGWYWEDAVDSRIVIRSEISANNLESFSIQPLKNFGSFDIYFASTEGNPAAKWLTGRVLGASADSPTCFNLARRWLDECLTSHDSCRASANSMALLPARVIDLGPESEPLQPRLRISSEGERGQWIALSHCWGSARPLETTQKTLAKWIAGIPLAQFPPLFRDALCIVRELGYQYLWIDSLCIIQDSNEDWSRQSAEMEAIYGKAALCVAAEHCADSGTGIFESGNKVRETYRESVQVPCFNVKEPGTEGAMRIGPNWLQKRSRPGPLSERAWTLQEEVLSTRTLKWTSKQLEWGCRTMERVEQFPDQNFDESDIMVFKQIFGSPSEAVDTKVQTAVYSLWNQIVSRMSVRKITKQSDRFPALSGIARVVQQRTGWCYEAGLWKEKMHEQLLWTLGGNANQAKPSEEYVAPSWSWGSMFYYKDSQPRRGDFFTKETGHRDDSRKRKYPGIEFREIHRDWTTTTMIENVEVDTIGGDFGQVHSGKLELKGLARRTGKTLYIQILTEPIFERLEHGEALEDDDDDQTPPIGERYYGLILNQVRDRRWKRCFVRVGTFHSHTYSGSAGIHSSYDRDAIDCDVSLESYFWRSESEMHWSGRWRRRKVTIV